MIDYIKTLNYITDKITAPTCTISIIIILLIVIPIILAFFFSSDMLSLFATLCLLIFGILWILPIDTTHKPINTKVLKEQNITETIDARLLTQAYDIDNMDIKSLSYINDNTYNYDNFKLSAILEHLNIKSINNFCSNIIYLDNYYNNHYQDQSKYDWINQKLNEFYKLNNNTNASTDEILKNLKN